MNESASLYKSLYDPKLSEFNMPQRPMGIDAALQPSEPPKYEDPTIAGKKEMAKTANAGMSAGGSAGQILTGAGASGLIAGAGPVGAGALAAGLALSYMEQKKQEEAAYERAVIEEATNRKNAVQNAIAGQMNAARMLGV